MTDQHRATPEQWALVASAAADGSATHSCLLELRDRIAAQASQFRGAMEKVPTIGQAQPAGGLADWSTLPGIANGLPNLDLASLAAATSDHERAAINMASCPSVDRIPDFAGAAPRPTPEPRPTSAPDAIVRRVEALEATQHAHADVSRLSDAEREQFYAELAKPGTWRPLDIETTYGSKAAVDAAQILRAPMVVEGTFEHGGETYRFKAKPEPKSAMAELRATSAPDAMTDEQLKIARELGYYNTVATMIANCNTLKTTPKITTDYETFVLLQCWYEGDSNLVDGSFVACGDIESLKLLVPPEAELFMPWQDVPDDGHYGDKRKRFRIALAPFFHEFNPPCTRATPASAEAQPAGGLVERVATVITLAKTSRAAAEDVLSEVAQAALQMHPDKNLTWERVAQWLEQEADQ